MEPTRALEADLSLLSDRSGTHPFNRRGIHKKHGDILNTRDLSVCNKHARYAVDPVCRRE